MRKLFALAAVGALFCLASAMALAQNTAVITVNENGDANLTTNFSPPEGFAYTGVLATDPGPGGRTGALTYSLLGPPSLVAGDVFVLDPGSLTTSDVIRFNSTGPYDGSLVFYSLDSLGDLADGAGPTLNYLNTTSVIENGSNLATYSPIAGQPGFISGFATTYNIQSHVLPGVVPEGDSFMLLAAGLLPLAGLGVWNRRFKKKA